MATIGVAGVGCWEVISMVYRIILSDNQLELLKALLDTMAPDIDGLAELKREVGYAKEVQA